MYYPLLFYNMIKIFEFNNWYWNEYYPFCVFMYYNHNLKPSIYSTD